MSLALLHSTRSCFKVLGFEVAATLLTVMVNFKLVFFKADSEGSGWASNIDDDEEVERKSKIKITPIKWYTLKLDFNKLFIVSHC